MKDLEVLPETGASSIKLGIVRLGRAGGKVKYTLVDEENIKLVNEYTFEARLEIDRNGTGAAIYAYAHPVGRRSEARLLHEMLWERHFGGIASGFRVAHLNGITMDNTRQNLYLCPIEDIPAPALTRACSNTTTTATSNHLEANDNNDNGSTAATTAARGRRRHGDVTTRAPSSAKQSREQTMYWTAIQQLPPDDTPPGIDESSVCGSHFGSQLVLEADDSRRQVIVATPDSEYFRACFQYYECHYPPCTRMECEPREFSICGRCQTPRYCGPACQQRDWPAHKRHCKPVLAQAIAAASGAAGSNRHNHRNERPPER